MIKSPKEVRFSDDIVSKVASTGNGIKNDNDNYNEGINRKNPWSFQLRKTNSIFW